MENEEEEFKTNNDKENEKEKKDESKTSERIENEEIENNLELTTNINNEEQKTNKDQEENSIPMDKTNTDKLKQFDLIDSLNSSPANVIISSDDILEQKIQELLEKINKNKTYTNFFANSQSCFSPRMTQSQSPNKKIQEVFSLLVEPKKYTSVNKKLTTSISLKKYTPIINININNSSFQQGRSMSKKDNYSKWKDNFTIKFKPLINNEIKLVGQRSNNNINYNEKKTQPKKVNIPFKRRNNESSFNKEFFKSELQVFSNMLFSNKDMNGKVVKRTSVENRFNRLKLGI